ncbi:MAG TPA: TonB-dependent receptor, partial [Vicinamibacterales bacterium]
LTPSTWDTTGAPFRRTDGMGKAHLQLSPDLALSGTVNGYRNRTTGRSNGELGPQEDDIVDRTVNAGVSADWRLRPTSALQVRAYHARYDEESTGFLAPPASTPLDPGALRERLSKLDASFSQVIGSRQQLQVGAEWWHNTYDGINRLRNDEAHEATTGVLWGQHRLTLHDRVTTTLGLRVDSHSEFGTAVSPKIAANARLTDVLRVRASAGRGFRAPDLGQLYYRFLNPTNFYQVIGNPNLDPEYANSYQLGGEFTSRGRRARLGVNLFRNDVRDLIESVSLGFVATPAQLQQIIEREGLDPSFRPVLGRLLFVYRNVSDVVTQGVELDGDLALARGLEVGGAYTWLDARDEENDVRLTGRHAHQGHVRLGWTLHRLGLRANLRGTFYSDWPVTRVTDSTGSTVETIAPSFALWDAFVSMPVVRGLDAFLSIENLADSQDPNTGVILPNGSPAAIYRPDAGRTFRIGVRWNWHR